MALPAHAAMPPINFTVTTSEAVNVTGSPQIQLDVDGTTRYASYVSGSGTSSLTFSYTPTIGDLDLNGIAIASSTVDLNGGSIVDLNGNTMSNLAFTPPATSGIKVDYPSIALDFIADADGRYTVNGIAYNTLPSLLTAISGTYTRASTASYTDSTGVIQSAPSNTPRFDYDPVTLTAKGLMIEETRTNFFRNSSALPTSTNLAPTKTNNVDISPDGTMTADQVATTGHGSGVYGNPVDAPLTAGTTYTLSAYVKRISGVNLLIFGVPNSFTNNAGDWSTTYNFSTNTFSSTNVNFSNVKSQNVGNGWIRLSFTATVAGGGTGGGPLLYSSGGAMTFLMWGSQIEAGTSVTSYIPTSGVTATRADDVLTLPHTIGANGTWYSQFQTGLISTQVSIVSTFPSGQNVPKLAKVGTSLRIVRPSVGMIGSINIAPATTDSDIKAALSYSPASSSISGNGLAAASGTSGGNGTATSFRVGVTENLGGEYINGTVKSVKYYPQRATDTQLQLLTQ